MADRPRLLFVSPRFLFPMDQGGKIRTGNILRNNILLNPATNKGAIDICNACKTGMVSENNAVVGKFIIDGNSLAVIRNGPYRGMLLVSRHMYRPAPEFGAYEPTFVIRPDGKQVLKVPGSDDDDAAVERWLRKHGWEAW